MLTLRANPDAHLLVAISLLLLCLVAVPVQAAEESVASEAEAAAADDDSALTVEEILQRDPQTSDYVDTPRCISTTRIRSVQVLDEKHVVFRLSRNEYYLVQFKHRCPSMRRGNTVIYETRSNRLCTLDNLRAATNFGNLEPGPPCAIPGFQSVSKEGLAALKEALKAERKKPSRDKSAS
ncbi:MAG: DUF6491 family protein [Pseudomonadota bacterium]